MQIKPYASCRWSHAAIDGFYALLPEFTIDEVKKVDVYTFKAGAESVSGRNPTNMFEMQFSIPHVFGMVMYDESLIYMQESSITNQDVIAFSEKVEVHLEQKYEDMFNKGMLPAKVVIELKNGEILEKEILRMKGEQQNPISAEEHKIKVETLINSTPFENVKEYANSIINTE